MDIETMILKKRSTLKKQKHISLRKMAGDLLMEKLRKYKKPQRIFETHLPENYDIIADQVSDDHDLCFSMRLLFTGQQMTQAQKNRVCFAVILIDGFEHRIAHWNGDRAIVNHEIFKTKGESNE